MGAGLARHASARIRDSVVGLKTGFICRILLSLVQVLPAMRPDERNGSLLPSAEFCTH